MTNENFLTWGVNGFGDKLYLCRHCGHVFGYYKLLFEDEVKHNCKDYKIKFDNKV